MSEARDERAPGGGRTEGGTTPQGRGRYPDYDVLAEAPHWDRVTRELVLQRATRTPPVRFFGPAEERALRAFCDLVVAQDGEPRIPVLEMVDEKLYEGRLDGFRYADMPRDDETWRRVAAGLDETAKERAGADFAACGAELQEEICADLAAGELRGGVWEELPPARAWTVIMRALLSEFYSHPWTWNEIGYGGPAYPRGYMRLGAGQREPGEAEEVGGVDPVRATPRKGPE